MQSRAWLWDPIGNSPLADHWGHFHHIDLVLGVFTYDLIRVLVILMFSIKFDDFEAHQLCLNLNPAVGIN